MEPNNDIIKYIEALPAEIQKIISDDIWEQRVIDIAQKYSLNETQKEDLINLVLLIIVGLNPTDELKDNIASDLSVSEIVSEQIIEDLNKRVFEYLSKEIDSTTNKEEVNKLSPEVRPEILPVKESDINTKVSKNNIPDYTPKQKVVVDREPVQTPVSVPRFKAVPLSDNEIGADFIPKLVPKPSAGGIMESKLNNVTAGITETKKETSSSPVTKNYSVDPYREPLN
jgi:Ran GTPase-activating protein (RanGAP) involved in mRNA processing and transport